MRHIIQECILEYQLTYLGERLFEASILRAFIKSIKESFKCLVDLIKSYNKKDISKPHQIKFKVTFDNRISKKFKKQKGRVPIMVLELIANQSVINLACRFESYTLRSGNLQKVREF